MSQASISPEPAASGGSGRHYNKAFLFSPGPFGGAEQVVLSGIQALEGVGLWIIEESRNPKPSIEFQKRCTELGIEFKKFTCRSKFDPATLRQLVAEVRADSIRLIHSHGMKANFFNSMLPVKRIATQHGKTSHDFKIRLLESIEHLALMRMDRVVCVSEAMFAASSYRNQILIENFLSLDVSKDEYSSDAGIKLVCIGRLSFEKGVADLIHAIKGLSGENISLTLVGDGNQMTHLREISSGMDNIEFVGFQKDIRPYLIAADALVMPSHREGLPMTLIEATAAGLPVIASNVGGIPTLVHENGYLFESRNIADIREKIIKFRANRNKLNEKAKFYRQTVRRKYSLDTWVKSTNGLYGSLL
jgi:glycosyltransferase involved in cell wall biosynthesis